MSFYEPRFFTPYSEVNAREPTDRNYLMLYYGTLRSEKLIRMPQIQIQIVWNGLDEYLKKLQKDSEFKKIFTTEAINSYV